MPYKNRVLHITVENTIMALALVKYEDFLLVSGYQKEQNEFDTLGVVWPVFFEV